MKREEYETMSDMEAWEADDSTLGGICVVIFILLFILCVTMTLVNDCHAAEIVYYDDDSCVVVEIDTTGYEKKSKTVNAPCPDQTEPNEYGTVFSCLVFHWETIEYWSPIIKRDTVTYVRKEAEPKHCHGDSIVSFKGFYSPSWADELDIVANLDSMVAGSCIRIPHDAPTHYFVDTMITKEGCWGFEFCYDTLIDTTFVYEVE